MEADLYTQSGERVGTLVVSDDVFGIEPNLAVMHQARVRQLANARLGTHSTRGRGQVRGSTRKLFRQKGTGRARQGSIRAPHRRGGGVSHGPRPRSYEKNMPRKMRRLAVRSALSAQYEHIRFVQLLSFDEPRTKNMLNLLSEHAVDGKTLIVIDKKEPNIQLSARNLPHVKILLAHYLNVIDLLRFDTILFTEPAVRVAEGYLVNQLVGNDEEA
jgi:large subunit ribosomal protein L4